jgi:hypothetical protein
MRAAGMSDEMIRAWGEFRVAKMREVNPQRAHKMEARWALWQKWRQYVQEQEAKKPDTQQHED